MSALLSTLSHHAFAKGSYCSIVCNVIWTKTIQAKFKKSNLQLIVRGSTLVKNTAKGKTLMRAMYEIKNWKFLEYTRGKKHSMISRLMFGIGSGDEGTKRVGGGGERRERVVTLVVMRKEMVVMT
ncbi:Ion-translocating oxidoreductase complex subunit C [Bienertia sinuspersici]